MKFETWDAKPRANFYMADDTVLFLFNTQPEGTTEGIVKLSITMAGKLADVDRHVAIKDLGGSPFNPVQSTRLFLQLFRPERKREKCR